MTEEQVARVNEALAATHPARAQNYALMAGLAREQARKARQAERAFRGRDDRSPGQVPLWPAAGIDPCAHSTAAPVPEAKGIIMAQYGWPEGQAFDTLRRASQRLGGRGHRDDVSTSVDSSIAWLLGDRAVSPMDPVRRAHGRI